jgi:hypothetical protein
MKSLLLFIFSLCVSPSLLAQSNPVPFLSQPLLPASAAPGGPSFTLAVNGTGFLASSTVNWNGNPRATRFVTSTELTAEISASDIAHTVGAAVTVSNLPPGGGISNSVWFEVTPQTAVAGFFSRADYLSETVQAVSSGDFNGDGVPDLAVAIGCLSMQNCSTGGVTILLGGSSGKFTVGNTYAAGVDTVSVTTADFDGDGKLDLAVLNGNCQFFNCPIGEISILLGNGDGTFRSAINYSTASAPVNIIAADFNGDGKIDLATANNCGYSCNNGAGNALSILLGNGDGTFQPFVNYQLNNSNNAIWVAAGDVNKDGKLDLVAVDYCATSQCGGPSLVSILKGNGDGTFQSPVDVPVGNYPSAVAVADMNGDGNPDILLTLGGLVIDGVQGLSRRPANPPELSNPGFVSVLLGNGNGTFQKGITYPTGSQPATIAVGDFNGDGILDVATSNLEDLSATSGSISILLGNGDGTLTRNIDYPTSFAPQSLVVSDFNRDGRLDLATANQGGTVSVLLQALVQVSSSSVQFPGAVLLGQSSTTQPVKITNIGPRTLNVFRIAITGANSHDFAQQNDCGSQIAPGQDCVIEVKFSPALPGLRVAALTIADDAAGGRQTIQLSGQGTIITFSPTSLAFGDQAVGTTSVSLTTTMTDTGERSIRIFRTISVDGPDASDFKQTHTCGNSLKGKQSCTISVTFTPKAQGSRTAWITIYDDGGGSPQRVALSGTGT